MSGLGWCVCSLTFPDGPAFHESRPMPRARHRPGHKTDRLVLVWCGLRAWLSLVGFVLALGYWITIRENYLSHFHRCKITFKSTVKVEMKVTLHQRG